MSSVFDVLKRDPWPKVVDMLALTIDRFPACGDRYNELIANGEPEKLVDLLSELSSEPHMKGFLRLTDEELEQIRRDVQAAHDPLELVQAVGALSGAYEELRTIRAWDQWCQKAPRDELLGVAELAQLLGWDKAKVSTYVRRGKLPEPDYQLASGPVWRRQTIEQWRRAESPS